MMKTLIRWSVLVVLLGYVILMAAWARDEARRNVCRGVEIIVANGNAADSVTNDGVLYELRKYPSRIVGTPLSQLDTRAIEKYLGDMPQFEEAICNITTSGNLRVRIVPMVPAARIFDGDESYYINKEGKRMPSKATYFVDVPVVTGNFSKEFPAAGVLPLVKFIEKDKDLNNLVGMIYARSSRDLYLVPRIHGHIINFGDTTDLENKSQALLTFYRKVLPYKGWEEYDTISVKYKGQVVATRRDKSRPERNIETEEDPDLEETYISDDID